MFRAEERRRVYQHAYLPEHLADYVAAVSGARPHLHDDFIYFSHQKHLIFIGYPLVNHSADIRDAYHCLCERHNPSTVALIAPEIWLPADTCEKQPADRYYKLSLPLRSIDPAVAYMVRRAERELHISQADFGKEHRRLVARFLAGRDLSREQKYIFKHIANYLKRSASARLLEARKKDVLIAFTIVDLGSQEYAFYLFNFRSQTPQVPGASDLLFREMVNLAQSEGKKFINLGLGINTGIRRFKEKWGGVSFLPYASALVHRGPVDLGRLAKKL